MKEGSILVNWGENGGYGLTNAKGSVRLALGRLAITYFRYDLDDVLYKLPEPSEPGKERENQRPSRKDPRP